MLRNRRLLEEPALGRTPSPPTRGRLVYAGAVIALMALGLGLRKEALSTGFVADDYAQLGMLQGHYAVPRSPLDLFNFSNGTAAEGTQIIRAGFYPWFAHPQVRLTMLRPLSSAMIWLDFTLFGNDPLPYHLHSLFWWLAMLAAMAWLFQRLFRPKVAIVAFAFVVLDEAHGVPLAWIANRCALVSITLSLIALGCHLRWREGGGARFAFFTCALSCIALGFGEYALSAFAYFIAYELFERREPLLVRLRALAPAGVPSVAYAALRSVTGHGPQHSGVYVTPDDNLLGFLGAMLQRVPVMYADLAMGLRAEFWTFGFPWTAPLVQARWVPIDWLWSPEPWRRIHERIGGALLVLIVIVVLRARRTMGERNIGWMFFASFLSILPVVGSFPSSRLLLTALVGFSPMLAAWVVNGVEGLRAGGTRRLGAWASALAAIAIGCYHVTIPAWLTRTEVVGLYVGSTAIRKAVLELDADPKALPGQRLIVLAALEGGTSMYIPLTRRRHGASWPKRCYTLSLTNAPHWLLRDGPSSFVLSTTPGFTMLATAPEQLLRDPEEPLHLGERVNLDGLTVTVAALGRGRPTAIRVEFDVPLEDPSLHFVLPTPVGIRRFPMPAIGQSVVVPAPVIPSA